MIARALLLAALVGSVSGLAAQEAGPGWNTLTAPQRSALAPLQGQWASIDEDRKRKWIQVADRFGSMPAPERERIQQRMTEWARMTPADRGRARLQFQEARQLPAEERQARWEAYKALPEEQRRQLAERARPANGQRPAPRATASEDPKRNVVTPAPLPAPRPVAPAIVQAKPGATTSLVTRPAAPPAHQQSGLPKIAATPGFVDSATLLPQRGAQGAAVRAQPRDKSGKE